MIWVSRSTTRTRSGCTPWGRARDGSLRQIRGAISGALKKKLGLTVEATRTREVGPNKTGAN